MGEPRPAVRRGRHRYGVLPFLLPFLLLFFIFLFLLFLPGCGKEDRGRMKGWKQLVGGKKRAGRVASLVGGRQEGREDGAQVTV